MSQEELDLLTKDLCSRLRSRIWVKIGEFSDYTLVGYDSVKDTFTVELVDNHSLPNYITDVPAHHMKPYLRSMSNMTEEEKEELYAHYCKEMADNLTKTSLSWEIRICFSDAFGVDWLNARHFDYRGLIPMGLALEAKEGMYK